MNAYGTDLVDSIPLLTDSSLVSNHSCNRVLDVTELANHDDDMDDNDNSEGSELSCLNGGKRSFPFEVKA